VSGNTLIGAREKFYCGASFGMTSGALIGKRREGCPPIDDDVHFNP
jgi:hypothetical protein